MRIASFTQYIIALHAAAILLGYLLLGSSRFIEIEAVVITLLLDLFLLLAISVTRARSQEVVLIVAWFVLVFGLSRIFAYLFFPARSVSFAALQPLTAAEVSSGLLWMLAGTVALISGIFAAGLRFSSPDRKELASVWRPSGAAVSAVLILYLAITAYFTLGLQVGLFGSPENWGHPWGWLMRVFDTDAALMICIIWCFISRSSSRLEFAMVIFAIITWCLFFTFLGSRGGAFRIGILCLIAVLALGMWRISTYRLATFLGAFVLANGLLFFAGTIVRYEAGEIDGWEAAFSQVDADWSKPSTASEPADITPLRKALVEPGTFYASVTQHLASFSQRLGVIDYPIVIVSRTADADVVSKYLNPVYNLKVFANNLVPGDIFSDSDIMSNRAFTMAYRGFDEAHARTAMLSEPWTIWGYTWLVFGPVVGLVVLFLGGAGLQILWALGLKHTAGYWPVFCGAFLFIFVVSGFLGLLGLDQWMAMTVHYSVSVVVTILLINFVQQIPRFLAQRAT